MKETSNCTLKSHENIALIQNTLANQTFAQFIQLDPWEIRELATLLALADSEQTFAAAFPPKEVLSYQKQHDILAGDDESGKTKRQKRKERVFATDAEYANWCCHKLQQKMQRCAHKMADMLKSDNFSNSVGSLSSEALRAYEKLYDVVVGDGRSLADYHRGRQLADMRL